MRKLLILAALLVSCTFAAKAQSKSEFDPAGRWIISIMGGPMYQRNENSFVYEYRHMGQKLITYSVGAAVGYDFTSSFGLRGVVEYGLNRGCANYYQTSARGFYPYNFKNVSGFVDAMMHFNGLNAITRRFAPKAYAGIGVAHTFGFDKPSGYGDENPGGGIWSEKFHPWQRIYESNMTFGFRLGGILEYDFASGIGLFADLCGEAYTDMFNGLAPNEEDHEAQGKGYAGFPLDLRLTLSFGITYRFR